MKIALIGASAGVGLLTAARALKKGHDVVTLSRRLEPLPEHPKLHKVQGSSTDLKAVAAAVTGADAVLVTLGTGRSTRPTTLYSDSARVLVETLKGLGATPPLIVLTGFGSGDSWDYNRFPMKIFFSLLLTAVYADKTEMERIISQTYPRWEMVRPGVLTNGPETGHYQVHDSLSQGMRVGSISRADVAHFLVEQAENPTFLGRYPALGG